MSLADSAMAPTLGGILTDLEQRQFQSVEEPVVSEDDWELGPACGLDPEVCESCQ